jgi:hypothetical protein
VNVLAGALAAISFVGLVALMAGLIAVAAMPDTPSRFDDPSITGEF